MGEGRDTRPSSQTTSHPKPSLADPSQRRHIARFAPAWDAHDAREQVNLEEEGSAVSSLKAVMLNCTLKPSPEVSNTEALMRNVKTWWDGMDVETEIVRV